MISKFNKLQNSWIIKIILVLTAMSFMSLFGVASYITGKKNVPVIKVDDFVVYQDEVSLKFDQELRLTQNLFGENFEINDTIKTAIMQRIVQSELEKAIINRTAENRNVYIGNDLIRKIIFSQPEFMDESGHFSPEKLRRILSVTGWSEARYVDALRNDIKRQHLVLTPVDNVNVPQIIAEYIARAENQKKIFEYIKISKDNLKVDRKISQEELLQYYQDFAVQFMEPEKRDVSFIFFSLKDVEDKTVISESEIEEYYQANLTQFSTPEQRSVLQMVFDKKDDADKAFNEVKDGEDFFATAENLAQQTEEETNLGSVSKDMMIVELGDAVFRAKTGDIIGPMKSEFGWHIMKLTDIKPATKMPRIEVNKKISEMLRSEKSVNSSYNLTRQIEDKIGAGSSLADIAKSENILLHRVFGLTDEGRAKSIPQGLSALIKSKDFIDTAFSYTTGEVSQVIETDEGFFVLSIDKITEAHAKDISLVRGEIEKMWLENEKNAMIQELVNDVTADIENGEAFADIARRFNLNLQTTQSIKRSDNFEKLSPTDMLDLFQENIGSPRVINLEQGPMIVVPTKLVDRGNKPSPEETSTIRMKLQSTMMKEFAELLIKGYGNDYDVRVKYRQLGLAD